MMRDELAEVVDYVIAWAFVRRRLEEMVIAIFRHQDIDGGWICGETHRTCRPSGRSGSISDGCFLHLGAQCNEFVLALVFCFN